MLMLIAAHRGLWENAPENSIRAFYAAINAGAEAIEMDVRVTSDGVPILMHDDDIGRTTTGGGLAETNTWAQFQTYFLRDRRGCPATDTGDMGTSFGQALDNFANNGLIYVDGGGVQRGTTLIVNIAGKQEDQGRNLMRVIDTYNQEAKTYPQLIGAVDFKAPLSSLPRSVKEFIHRTGWDGRTNNFGLIPIISIEDKGHQAHIEGLMEGKDERLQSYLDPESPVVLHFETNQLYNGDGSQSYTDYLSNPRYFSQVYAAAGDMPDNTFPEGEPDGGRCCRVTKTLPWQPYSFPKEGRFDGDGYYPAANALVWPQYPLVPLGPNGAESSVALCSATLEGMKSPGCLDLRGRIGFLLSTGMTVLTVDRVNDFIPLMQQLGRRDVSYLLQ
jgi:hypothetical protein